MPAKLKRLCVYICVDLWTVCVSISFYNGNNIKFCFETPSQYTFVNHFVVWIVSVACAISFNRFCERICSWLHSDFVWCVDATKPNEQKKPYDFFGYFDENPIRWHFVRMLICFLFECDCNPFELNNFLFWTTVELLNEFHSIAPNKFVALFLSTAAILIFDKWKLFVLPIFPYKLYGTTTIFTQKKSDKNKQLEYNAF